MNTKSTISPLGLVAVVFAITISPGSVLPAQAPDSVPTVDQILDRYIQALGGKANLEKITSRVAKGECENADWEAKGPFEVFSKAPNKLLTVMSFPDPGVIKKGFNGKVGWEQGPSSRVDELSRETLLQIQREADFYHDLRLKELYPSMRLVGKDKVSARDAYVVEATPSTGLPDKLYFDEETCLLVRSDYQVEHPGGKIVNVILYDDYRDVDGVKIPFSIYLSNLESGFSIKLMDVKHNVSIDDAKFEKPTK